MVVGHFNYNNNSHVEKVLRRIHNTIGGRGGLTLKSKELWLIMHKIKETRRHMIWTNIKLQNLFLLLVSLGWELIKETCCWNKTEKVSPILCVYRLLPRGWLIAFGVNNYYSVIIYKEVTTKCAIQKVGILLFLSRSRLGSAKCWPFNRKRNLSASRGSTVKELERFTGSTVHVVACYRSDNHLFTWNFLVISSVRVGDWLQRRSIGVTITFCQKQKPMHIFENTLTKNEMYK